MGQAFSNGVERYFGGMGVPVEVTEVES